MTLRCCLLRSRLRAVALVEEQVGHIQGVEVKYLATWLVSALCDGRSCRWSVDA